MNKGKLKIYFGYFHETAKTRTMIQEILEKYQNKENIIIADIKIDDDIINEELKQVPRLVYSEDQKIDIDSLIRMKPAIVVLDSIEDNSKQSRNAFRYQDVLELLNNGINVYTTLNVFNIDSLKDFSSSILKDLKITATIPDYVFMNADAVEFIDIPVKELINRTKQKEELKGFNEDELKQLRTIALNKVIDHDNYKRPSLKNLSNLNFLVCISSSPSSVKSIKWTAKMAGAFHAPWKALYIGSNHKNLSKENKEVLESNFKLVKSLGGEVVRIIANNIDLAIIEYAHLNRVTNIVIGKSRVNKKIFTLHKPSLEDKIINNLKGVDIHITPDSEYNNQKYVYEIDKKEKFKFSVSDLIKTFGIILFTTLLNYGINVLYPSFNETILYLLAVLLVSRMTKGYFYGLFSALLSVFIFLFLFVEPSFDFSVTNIDHLVTFIAMFFVAITTSMITTQSKIKTNDNIQTITEIERLNTINQELIKINSKEEVLQIISIFFKKEFDCSTYLYEIRNNKNIKIELSTGENKNITSDESKIIELVNTNHQSVGYKTNTLGERDELYIPLLIDDNVVGILEINNSENLDEVKEHENFVNIFLSQIALVLEKQELISHRQYLSDIASKENVRSNLLRSISHDLRTPLTSIYGSISTIIEDDNISKEDINQTLEAAKEDINWLIRMVENLLSITRINQETKRVIKNLEVIEEVVSESVVRVKKRFPKIKIDVLIPKEMLIIPIDGTLIEQVIINLLENVIKHALNVKKISLIVENDFDKVIFKVSDDGENINLTKIESILNESKIIDYSDKNGQTGIGLLICKTIIQAHQGQFSFYKNNTKGATFYFTLPKEESYGK